jgi:hypothetical protein
MTRNLRIGTRNQPLIRTNLCRMEKRTTKTYFGVSKFPKQTVSDAGNSRDCSSTRPIVVPLE